MFWNDDTPIEAVIARERALSAEYGPLNLKCWFMYDNHRFAKLTGTPEQMGNKALQHMADDKFCGSVFVRTDPGDQEINALSFHGNYRNPDATRERIEQWVKDVEAILAPRGVESGPDT